MKGEGWLELLISHASMIAVLLVFIINVLYQGDLVRFLIKVENNIMSKELEDSVLNFAYTLIMVI